MYFKYNKKVQELLDNKETLHFGGSNESDIDWECVAGVEAKSNTITHILGDSFLYQMI